MQPYNGDLFKLDETLGLKPGDPIDKGLVDKVIKERVTLDAARKSIRQHGPLVVVGPKAANRLRPVRRN